mgnify:CR=1 FL=1
MHAQAHVTSAPDFEPNDPHIQVFVHKDGVEDATEASATASTEYDVFACDAFRESINKWSELMEGDVCDRATA